MKQLHSPALLAVCMWRQSVSFTSWHQCCWSNYPNLEHLRVFALVGAVTRCWPACVAACFPLQGVNGLSRQVTVWGRKDSITYCHSPYCWRQTTMVSSLIKIRINQISLFVSLKSHIYMKLIFYFSFWKATSFGICIGSSRGKVK